MKSTLTGLILAAIPLVSFAQTEETNRLKDIVKQQEQAKAQNAELEEKKRAVQNEISDLNSQMIRLAADSSSLERTGRDLDQKLTRLEAKNAALKQAIYGDRKTLAKLLGALQRIENNPPPALAIAPDNAADAVIAAKLTASISQRLTSRTESLSQQLEDLAANRSKITAEQQEIQKNEADLAARRQSIRTLVGQKTELEQSVSNSQAEAQKRAAALAAQADDLRELITKLEQAAKKVEPRSPRRSGIITSPDQIIPRIKPRSSRSVQPVTLPPDTARFTDARGRLRAPVQGKISRTYSSKHTGLSVKTRPKAQIVAPYAGRVEFAGAFKNYDNVIILNVGEGYFILLTGLGEIYAKSGNMVARGEPVALMPFNTNSAPELYIEFRKKGTAINPTPWLGTAFASQG